MENDINKLINELKTENNNFKISLLNYKLGKLFYYNNNYKESFLYFNKSKEYYNNYNYNYNNNYHNNISSENNNNDNDSNNNNNNSNKQEQEQKQKQKQKQKEEQKEQEQEQKEKEKEEEIKLDSKIDYYLGKLYFNLKNYNKSEIYLLNSLMKRLICDKYDTIDLIKILKEIIILYQETERNDQAISYNDVIKIINENIDKNEKSVLILITLHEITMTNYIHLNEINNNLSDILFQFLIQHCKLYLQSDDITTTKFMNNYGECLRSRKLFHESCRIHEETLSIRRNLVHSGHIDSLFLAESANNLALVYRALGLYDNSEKLLLEAIQIRTEKLNHSGLLASSFNNLAEVYRDKGKFLEAISTHDLAIQMYEQFYGIHHPNVYNAQGNKGITLYHFSSFSSELGKQLIHSTMNYLISKQYESKHPWTQKFQSELLYIHAKESYNQFNYQLAFENYQKLLTENRFVEQSIIYNLMRNEYWIVWYHRGLNYYEEGKYSQAKDTFESFIEGNIKMIDINPSLFYDGLFMKAETYRMLGEYTKALRILENLFDKKSIELTEINPICCKIMNSIAICYMESLNYSKSLTSFDQALRIITTIVENQSIIIINDSSDMNGSNSSRENSNRNDYSYNFNNYNTIYTIKMNTEESNYLLLAQILYDYCEYDLRMSSYESAMTKLNESYELRKKYLNDNHLLIGDIYFMKSKLYIEIGNYQDAEKYSNWANKNYTDNYQLKPHIRIVKLLILKSIIQISIQNGNKALEYSKEAKQLLRIIFKSYFNRNHQKYHPLIELCDYVTQLSLFTSGKYNEIILLYNSPQFLALYGETLIMLSQYEDSIINLQQAIIDQEKITNKYHINTLKYQLILGNSLLLNGNLKEYNLKCQEIDELIKLRNKIFTTTQEFHNNDNNNNNNNNQYFIKSLPFYRDYLISKAKKHHFYEEFYQADQYYNEVLQYSQQLYGYNHPIVYEIIYEQLVSMTERGSGNLDHLMTLIDNNLKNLELYYTKEHPKIIKSIFLFTTFCLMYRSEDLSLMKLCYNELQSLGDIILNIYNKTTITYVYFLRLMNSLNYLLNNYSTTHLLINEELTILQLIFPNYFQQPHYEFGYCYLNQIILEIKQKNYKLVNELILKSLDIFQYYKGNNSFLCKFLVGLKLINENTIQINKLNDNELNEQLSSIIDSLNLNLHIFHPLIRFLQLIKNRKDSNNNDNNSQNNHTTNNNNSTNNKDKDKDNDNCNNIIENQIELKIHRNSSKSEINYLIETKEKQFENLQNQLNNSINENKLLLTHINEKENLLKLSEEENLKQRNENELLKIKLKELELIILQQNEEINKYKIDTKKTSVVLETRADDILKKAQSILKTSKKIHP